MKAFLLAAGLGTRLRPLTDTIPKCLVPIRGKALLGWWIELFRKHGVDEVLINLHHFPEQVRSYLEKNSGGIKFTYFFEETLLGSGGTLRVNKDFAAGEDVILVFYADNLTNINITSFVDFHIHSGQQFTMGLFRTKNPTACGIAELNGDNIIIDFEEKPKFPKSNLANTGIYAAHPLVLDLIPELELTDIGFHLLPKLAGKMAGMEMKDYLIDVGTHESLAKAEIDWKNYITKEGALI